MFPVLEKVLIILLSISVPSTVYLYAYPVFHGCAFPFQNHSIHVSTTAALKQHLGFPSPLADSIAPFKLLALGDPQLEGDTSLLDPEDGYFPSLTSIGVHLFAANSYHERLNVLSNTTKIVLWEELPKALQALRKQLDLFGNDYYLAHIYRTISWWTNPTHVTVLGDLVGSQWIEDEEFARRGWRYWQRVFRHGQKVDDEVTSQASTELLEEQSWKRRVINIAGNHDVGYAGDMSLERVERFNKVFGRANWEIKFRLPTREVADNTCTLAEDVGVPELRIVVLNSLNLDTPALSPELQTSTYNFINDVIGRSRPVEDRYTGTILLTHLPLHKESGICVDGPHFDFHTGDYGNGVKEQNHISYEAGKGILEGIFGMSGNLGAPGGGLGRHGIILTGHDHEGCDVYHHLPSDADKNARRWQAARWEDSYEIVNDSIPSIREITVRSMMGDFGGNAGLLSGWFDYDLGEWQFAYSSCAVGVQHIWWAIHILDIATAGLLLFIVSVSVLNSGSKLNADPRSKHKPPQGLSLPKGEKSGSSVSDGCCAKSTSDQKTVTGEI